MLKNFLNLKNANISRNLLKINKKNYNGLFERPTQSLVPHLQILGILETFKYFKYEYDLTWTLSIIITSSLIRIIQIPTYLLVKDVKVSKYIPNKLNIFISKWSHRLIYNDLYIDVKRNKIDNFDKKKMLKYYDINVILSYVPQFFLLFNNFRALNSMVKGDSSMYPNFTNDLFGMNLAVHDSTFIFPLIIFVNNYFFLKITNHPWLINYNNNKIKLVYLSFAISLFSIIWPKCYCVSWVSYCLTHIIIKKIMEFIYLRNKRLASYQYHVEKNYKSKIINWYNRIKN